MVYVTHPVQEGDKIKISISKKKERNFPHQRKLTPPNKKRRVNSATGQNQSDTWVECV